MKLAKLTPTQLRSIDRTLSGGTWTITAGAVLFSVLTVTPLVQRVTSDRWDWTAPILPIVVDAAVVIVIRLDATVSRLGESGGRWPDILRWLTGMFTVALNIGDSALKRDLVGVAVHAVAPTLLIATAEASLAYRRAINRALERIEREQREADEARRVHERQEREAREQAAREREERERAEREAERERAERIERERIEQERETERLRLEHERELAREQREAEEARRRDEADREERREARERADRERREREAREKADAERAAREQQERQARERAEAIARERRERRAVNTNGGAVNTTVNTRRAAPVNTPAKTVVNDDRLAEEDARALIVNTPGASVRDLADKTGWSIGWVSKVRREANGEGGDAEEATAA
ncbi:hypothetical protein GCM10010218_65660 [Streptomyces mashuensis]|uniref:DUF2637 domain-containing protein n=1 Tax=Streptomyces mashuensis TaxID=33904 RepID=A0A919BA18_9ACTN|nr:DUF2637 domain-containing protein [Streptomyces mashuensis]GHF75552.1 hypothetical protein GCM10010218_65660 [Streptomyces mashuensis]